MVPLSCCALSEMCASCVSMLGVSLSTQSCSLCRGSLAWMAEAATANKWRGPWRELWPGASWPLQSFTVRGLRWWSLWPQALMMAEPELKVCWCMSLTLECHGVSLCVTGFLCPTGVFKHSFKFKNYKAQNWEVSTLIQTSLTPHWIQRTKTSLCGVSHMSKLLLMLMLPVWTEMHLTAEVDWSAELYT